MSDKADRIDELDTFEAVAEFLNINHDSWSEEEKVAAGRFILRLAALRMNSSDAPKGGR